MSAGEALCVCGHGLQTHEHYRRGTECTLCGPEVCPRYRRAAWWRRLVARG